MSFSDFISLLGVNSVLFSVYLFLSFRLDLNKKINSSLCVLLLILSLPGAFLYYSAFDYIMRHTVSEFQEKEEILRFLVLSWHEPSRYEIEKYGLDCEGFERGDGSFDLRAWKQHELYRLQQLR